MWALQDLWKQGLHLPPPKLGRKLCNRHDKAILLPLTSENRGSVWLPGPTTLKMGKKRTPNRGLEGWWMAPRENNPILWACHVGRRWILRIPYPHLHVKPGYPTAGSLRNHYQWDWESPDPSCKSTNSDRNAIYQNRLALDYLLAAEGGMCVKFNLTNCCLQIDDRGRQLRTLSRKWQNWLMCPCKYARIEPQ